MGRHGRSRGGLHGRFHFLHHGRFGRGRWHGRGRWRGGFAAPDQQVMWAQSCLAQVVDPNVPQNGFLGPRTRHAIQMFQSQQQLPSSGFLDDNTVNALQSACSGQQAGDQTAAAPGQQAAPAPAGGPAPQSGPGPGGAPQPQAGQQELEYGFRPYQRFWEDTERWGWERDRRWPWLYRDESEAFLGSLFGPIRRAIDEERWRHDQHGW